MDYKKLTNDDQMDLAYLEHDKSHVIDKYGDRLRGLEKALKYYSQPTPQLYRGLYKEEVQQLGELGKGKPFSFKGYLSFSEKLKVGLSFGHGSRFVLTVKGAPGFSLWKYRTSTIESIRLSDPHEFDSIDGQYIIDSAMAEKEWILARNTKFEIVDYKVGHGYTVIEAKQV